MAVVMRTRKRSNVCKEELVALFSKTLRHELTKDAIIGGLGWKPLSEGREEHIKELVKNCLKGLVPDLFKGYFNIRRCDINSHNYTRFSKNLFIDKIKLEISKRAF